MVYRAGFVRAVLPHVLLAASLGVPLHGCGDDGASTSGSGTDGDTESTDGSTSLTTSPTSSISDTMDESTSSTGDTGVADTTGTSGPDTDGTTTSETGSTSGTPNTAPVAEDDFYLTSTGPAQLIVDVDEGVLANDSDPDGDPLTVGTFDAASEAGGVVAMNDDGSFSYTRPAGYWGEDRFSYEVDDGGGGMDTATVRIMVAPTAEPFADVAAGVVGFVIDGEVAGDRSGYAVGGGGDIDGDGLADLVVGADRYSEVAFRAGAGYVVSGQPGRGPILLSDVATGDGGFPMVGNEADGRVGAAVELAGDVDGDGLMDVIVGAPDQTGGGAAYVVFGKADGQSVSLSEAGIGADGFRIAGDDAGAELGYAVGPAGDVNGDGLDDVVVGAIEGDSGRGLVAVIYGKTGDAAVSLADLGTGSGLGFIVTGADTNADFGWSVRSAGDVDGDGLDDLVLGAPLTNAGGTTDAGRAFVVLGKPDDDDVALGDIVAGSGGFVIDGVEASDLAGHSVSAAGDVDGDGRADIVIGAIGADAEGADNVGRAYVVFGKTNTDPVALTDIVAGVGGFVIDGENQFDLAGWSVAGAGDMDGDGLSDLVIGAQGSDITASNSGRAYVVWGKSDDTAPVSLTEVATGLGGFALDGQASVDAAGWAVDGARDVNGDGFTDVVIGAYGASPGGMADAGRTYVVFGGDFSGRTDGSQTEDADTLYGTAQAETLVGGAGDDELYGVGGADVLYGGPGDDVIVLTGANAFFRVDGGTGSDTLRLEGSGIALDLTNYFDLAIADVEQIDLTGNGDNSLFLELRALRAISSASNVLTVTGDTGDEVVADLQNAGFMDAGSVGGQTVYTNGVLSLVVDDDVTAFVQL